MSTRLGHSPSGSVKVDLTPLIDCVFLLIVFFIVAGKIPRAEWSVTTEQSPLVWGFSSGPHNPSFTICASCLDPASRSGASWTVNGKPVDGPKDLEMMISGIAAKAVDSGMKIRCVIDSAPAVEFYRIFAALDAFRLAGIEEVQFAPPRVPLSEWPISFLEKHGLAEFARPSGASSP